MSVRARIAAVAAALLVGAGLGLPPLLDDAEPTSAPAGPGWRRAAVADVARGGADGAGWRISGAAHRPPLFRWTGAWADPVLSHDGSRVAFTYELRRPDSENPTSVLVQDADAKRPAAISRAPGGAAARGADPSVSADGSRMGYLSWPADEPDLRPAAFHVYDVAAGTTTRVLERGPDAGPSAAVLSGDGRHVAYVSSPYQVPSPFYRREGSHLFVKDLVSGRVTSAGVEGAIRDLAVSDDNSIVAFVAGTQWLHGEEPDGLTGVFVKDLVTATLVQVSTSLPGDPWDGWDAVALSADGATVAFVADDADLAPADGDNNTDLFVRDMVTGTVRAVFTTGPGEPDTGGVYGVSLSADGGRVAFTSSSVGLDTGGPHGGHARMTLYVGDLTSGAVAAVPRAQEGRLSGDGRTIAVRSPYPWDRDQEVRIRVRPVPAAVRS